MGKKKGAAPEAAEVQTPTIDASGIDTVRLCGDLTAARETSANEDSFKRAARAIVHAHLNHEATERLVNVIADEAISLLAEFRWKPEKVRA